MISNKTPTPLRSIRFSPLGGAYESSTSSASNINRSTINTDDFSLFHYVDADNTPVGESIAKLNNFIPTTQSSTSPKQGSSTPTTNSSLNNSFDIQSPLNPRALEQELNDAAVEEAFANSFDLHTLFGEDNGNGDIHADADLVAAATRIQALVRGFAVRNQNANEGQEQQGAQQEDPFANGYGLDDLFAEPDAAPAPTANLVTPIAQKVSASSKTPGAIDGVNLVASDVSKILERAASPSSIIGAISGDEEMGSKLWARAFGSKSAQKGTHASKTTSFGATIGGDVDLLEDEMLIGVAFTHAKFNVKTKDEAKVVGTVNMGSIYARHDILNHAFVTSSASYGLVDVKNLTFTGSKNKAHAFKANVNLGYNIALNNGVLVTPKIGLSYDNVRIKNLKLTSDAKGTKANMDRVSSDLSLSVAKNFKVSDDLNLRPEIHAGVNYVNNQNKLLNKAEGVLNSKTPKTSYNAGVSVLASGNNAVSLDLGYNFNWKSKYRAHSGFAKLEVKF